MWALAGTMTLVIVALVSGAAMAPPASVETISAAVASNQITLTQLSETVVNMAKEESDIKEQLIQATSAIIESQGALQKILSRSKKQGGSGQGGGSGSASSSLGVNDDVLREFLNEMIETLRENSASGKGNGSRSVRGSESFLRDILAELKVLNGHFEKQVASVSCPPPFMMLGPDCINVILDDLSWLDARNSCLAMGADLAQPTNVTELKIYVGNKYPRKSRRNFWIGAVYKDKIWQWLSGEPVEDGNWHTYEPSGNGDCLGMFDGWENPFTDFPCENERRAICQRM